VPPPGPPPPRDRILKCTKTEEFSSLNDKKGAEAGFRSRVGGRAYVKCTGWSGVGVRVGGNGGNPKKAESHLRRSESTQGAPGVQGGLFGVQEGAVGSQEVAGKWRCMNDFSQKVEDFSRFFEIGSFRPWRRRRWSRLAERSPKPVFPLKTDHGKWVSLKTRKIRRFSRRTSRPGYWPVIRLGYFHRLRREHAELDR
jgi:hypothetical protein